MNPGPIGADGRIEDAGVLELVQWQVVSNPIDHGGACCRTARRWLSAIHAGGAPRTPLSGLGWIADMYPRGPTRWPIPWCKLVEQENLDCGGQSAIAREVLRGNGAAPLAVQLLLRGSTTTIGHWKSAWQEKGVAQNWLFEGIYYHEAVGMADEAIVVFDPTRNWRISPDEGAGDGDVVAIRVSGGAQPTLRWGAHELHMGHWAMIQRQPVADSEPILG